MLYRYDQRHEYDPGDNPCPTCGGPPQVQWIGADTSADWPGTWWAPGMLTCPACELRGMVSMASLGDAQDSYMDPAESF